MLRRGAAADLIAAIPGSLGDRRSPLGELNWVLTAVADSIAWQLLPQALFRRLFRQDVLLAALLRNFVLADRLMWHLQATVVSEPQLPPMHSHPLWQVWDHAVDLCLAQLPPLAPAPTDHFAPTTFFADQLTALEIAIGQAVRAPLTAPTGSGAPTAAALTDGARRTRTPRSGLSASPVFATTR